MSKIEYQQGERYFTVDGGEVEFVSRIDGGFVVRSIREGEEGEVHLGAPRIVRELLDKPPVDKYDAKVMELREKIVELTTTKREIEESIRASQIDDKERKGRIMQNAALVRIDDFLAGQFTHFVYYRFGIKILSFDEAMLYKENHYDNVPNRVRLLCLYGKSEGNLEWGIHGYGDGSGSPEWVIPCKSLEDAKGIAREKLNLEFEKWRKEKGSHRLHSLVSQCKSLGFDVPEDAAKVAREEKLKNLTANRDKAKEDLEKSEAALLEEMR